MNFSRIGFSLSLLILYFIEQKCDRLKPVLLKANHRLQAAR
jgi:hypothetical protein